MERRIGLLRNLFKERLSRRQLGYKGMDQDLNLLIQRVTADLPNVGGVEQVNIAEGTVEEALKRLRKKGKLSNGKLAWVIYKHLASADAKKDSSFAATNIIYINGIIERIG